MSLPVTVYRWDDPGAPQFSNRSAADWINILRKCLVDGYGNKAPAGWSVAFDNSVNDEIAFRTASDVPGYPGGFLKMRSKYQNGISNDTIYIQTAPLITRIDPDWNTTPGASYLYSFGGTSYPDRWIVLATSLAFYILTSSTQYPYMAMGTRDSPTFGVGSLDSCYLNDVNGFGIFGKSSFDNASPHYQYSIGYIADGNEVGRYGEVTGADTRKMHELISPFKNLFSSSIAGPGEGSPNPVYGKFVIGLDGYYAANLSAQYQDSQGTPFVNSVLQPPIRGTWPGILVSSSPAYSDQLWPVTKEIFGQQHYLVPNPHNGSCGYWINAEVWYE
ncbi:hypothetical protein [Shewanella algae]|uniref:hypothetical protein n=1 Tax=Shewanella algae TaxID=38313 RepID=UPI00399BEFA6